MFSINLHTAQDRTIPNTLLSWPLSYQTAQPISDALVAAQSGCYMQCGHDTRVQAYPRAVIGLYKVLMRVMNGLCNSHKLSGSIFFCR